MSTMTYDERQLARQALGLPNSSGISYCNHFVTDAESPEGQIWERLCMLCFAIKRNGTPWTSGEPVYVLTARGAEAAMDPDEHLDSETRFPLAAVDAGWAG